MFIRTSTMRSDLGPNLKQNIKRDVIRKHSRIGEIAASVVTKVFNGNDRRHTPDAPSA